MISYDNTGDGNVGGGTGSSTPSGNTGSWQTLLEYQLNVTRACRVEVHCQFKQGHAASYVPWAAQIWFDGANLSDTWGGAPCDSIALIGSQNVNAGNHTIRLLWQAANSNVVVYRPRMAISWCYK